METQRGAALVIVMVLLASALVTAMMGMQSALVDKRLAGNFRASLQAQMNSGVRRHTRYGDSTNYRGRARRR